MDITLSLTHSEDFKTGDYPRWIRSFPGKGLEVQGRISQKERVLGGEFGDFTLIGVTFKGGNLGFQGLGLPGGRGWTWNWWGFIRLTRTSSRKKGFP